MRRKRIVSIGAVLLIAGLVIWFIKAKVSIADPEPAIRSADAYFSELKAGNAAAALGMYEQSIPTRATDALPRLLLSMQSKHGSVGTAELQSAVVAPKDDVACYWLTYNVARVSAKTVENLLLCPKASGEGFGIDGHAWLNPATGQHISFGVTVETKGFSVGNAP